MTQKKKLSGQKTFFAWKFQNWPVLFVLWFTYVLMNGTINTLVCTTTYVYVEIDWMKQFFYPPVVFLEQRFATLFYKCEEIILYDSKSHDGGVWCHCTSLFFVATRAKAQKWECGICIHYLHSIYPGTNPPCQLCTAVCILPGEFSTPFPRDTRSIVSTVKVAWSS